MNKVILIGRLTKDPDLRYATNGTAVCSFTLAVDRRKKRDGATVASDSERSNASEGRGESARDADFVNIVVWNKQGENCAKYLAKGRMAAVEGRLQIRSYDNKDGQKRYATEVVAEGVQFLSAAKEKPIAEELEFGEEVDEECPF